MPWLRPRRLLSRLLGLGTTVWLCRKVGCWARSFSRLGALVLRFVHRGRPVSRAPDYGHLLLETLYPGKRPSPAAADKASTLAKESRGQGEREEALRLLGEAVLLNPPDPALYLARAQVHAQLSDMVESLDDAELCVSLDANSADGWLAKGQAEHALGRATDAALSCQAGLRVDPTHVALQEQLALVRAEPPPNLLRQLRDLVFAARLGLENLFRTVEDPDKTTDAFVASNSELLDAQLGLLSQTLRVNTAVLFDSPMLCDAYEQIVYACSQLVSCAPAAFSKLLQNAPNVIEGLSLALRVGWHVHHSVPKLAANALVTLAMCPIADDALRRRALRHFLGGMLRWLLDARPEPDREGEEVCGCSCAVPWKAAACFLERFFETGRAQPWVREECEAWPDIAQLCQWLTLSVRDYHATPLGLVGLLQLPGVAAAAMRSEAVVNFFIPAPPLEEEADSVVDSVSEEPAEEAGRKRQAAASLTVGRGAASSVNGRFDGAAPSGAMEGPAWSFWRASQYVPSLSLAQPAAPGASPEADSEAGDSDAPEHLAQDPLVPPPQRLGEWLMASIGYLFLFIEGDVLFTVCACRALQAMASTDPGGDGVGRLLRSLWLGVPLLNKLSLCACSQTAALDLLHCILRGPCPGARSAARSLAHALSRCPRGLGEAPHPSAAANAVADDAAKEPLRDAAERELAPEEKAALEGAAVALVTARVGSLTAQEVVAAAAAASHAAEGEHEPVVLEEDPHWNDEEAVPSWAEFYQELLNELACSPDGELITLVNFDETARLLAEYATVTMVPRAPSAASDSAPRRSTMTFTAVPAAWNRFTERGQQSNGAEGLSLRLPLSFDDNGVAATDIGSEDYMNDSNKRGCAVLMSRRSIRRSDKVQNWAQAVAAAAKAGASAVVVFNNLDGMEPFRMGLFGERAPSIPAFMVGGADGAALIVAASLGCDVVLTSRPTMPGEAPGGVDLVLDGTSSASAKQEEPASLPPPWPLTSGRLQADVSQAWSLLEALSTHDEGTQAELQALLHRMSVPEKRVWLMRRLLRHHRSQQAIDGDIAEPPLAFVEGDRSQSSKDQLDAVRRQMIDSTGLGSDDLCGEFEVRFRDEQGVGSAVLREWLDTVAREAFLHPSSRLLTSYDRRQTVWPDPAAPFCNHQWQMDYEALGRLLGLALWQSCTLDLPLHPHVCSLLFGFPPEDEERTLAALEEVDEELYKMKVKWLLANPVADLGFGMTFTDPIGATDTEGSLQSADAEDGSAPSSSESSDDSVDRDASRSSAVGVQALPAVVQLRDRLPGTERRVPGRALLRVGAAEVALDGGSGEQEVTDENKLSYVGKLADWRLRGAIELQVDAMARGLRCVVPEGVLSELRGLLRPTEIAQLISGLGDISVDDWERHTAFSHGLSRTSSLVTWFFQAVRGWSESEEDRALLPQLLQFVTGSARVPVGGFAELVGFNGAKHPFTLARGPHLTAESLPTAHACICTLDLPPYEDFETCQAKLRQMLTWGRSHFDEAAGHREEEDGSEGEEGSEAD